MRRASGASGAGELLEVCWGVRWDGLVRGPSRNLEDPDWRGFLRDGIVIGVGVALAELVFDVKSVAIGAAAHSLVGIEYLAGDGFTASLTRWIGNECQDWIWNGFLVVHIKCVEQPQPPQSCRLNFSPASTRSRRSFNERFLGMPPRRSFSIVLTSMPRVSKSAIVTCSSFSHSRYLSGKTFNK